MCFDSIIRQSAATMLCVQPPTHIDALGLTPESIYESALIRPTLIIFHALL
jgi:hypothetical protein